MEAKSCVGALPRKLRNGSKKATRNCAGKIASGRSGRHELKQEIVCSDTYAFKGDVTLRCTLDSCVCSVTDIMREIYAFA